MHRNRDRLQSESPTGIAGIRKFLLRDRLGSVVTVTDAAGEIEEVRGYDPFGKPRDGDWADRTPATLASAITNRGFTDHEHLDESQLIHMNGRAYDYNLGRFLSVDPIIQAPGNSQSLNPYSYIMNNPLAGTDPSGYCSKTEIKDEGGVRCEISVTGSRLKQTYQGTINNNGSVSYTGPGTVGGNILVGNNGLQLVGTNVSLVLAEKSTTEINSPQNQAEEGSKPHGAEMRPVTNPFTKLAQSDVPILSRLLRLTDAVLSPLAGLGRGLATGDFTPHGPFSHLTPREEELQTAGLALTATGPIGLVRGGIARGTTYLYQKVGAAGEHLKFGITGNPATRYTGAELNGGQLRIIAQGERSEMLRLERQLHEMLPIGPEERQLFYIQKQVEQGLKPPPY
jgi:RHS repeat-associated protein